jgi:hypothetical protein
MTALLAMLRRLATAAAAPALLLSGGCGDSAGAEGAPVEDASIGAAEAGNGTDASEPEQPDPSDSIEPDYELAKTLVGSYAARITYRDVVTFGIAGTGSLVTTLLATAEISDDPDAEAVRLSVEMCDGRIAAPNKHLQDLVVLIPGASLRETLLEPGVLQVGRVDGTVRWKTDELHGTAGWKWSSPSDDLPVFEDDPRVVDQDADGLPGVSAEFTGHANGELYLALVYRFLFSGSASADGELTGKTTSGSRETLLGSSEAILLGMEIERAPDAETADNTVRLIRQSSPLSCDELIAQQETLFP